MSQPQPVYYPPSPPPKQGLSTPVKIAIVAGIVLAVLVVSLLAYAFLVGVQQGLTQTQVTSAQVAVSCNGCQPSLLGNYLFNGAIDDGRGSVSVQGGNFEQSHTWTLERNGQTPWIIVWTFQANQADGTTGTMSVVVTLNTGEQVFDKSTSVQFGVVSGSWST